MILLVIGVLLFATAHAMPAVDTGLRRQSIARFGADGHRGVFSLVVLISIAAIVIGWRSTEPTFVYTPPTWGRVAANLGMVLAFFLFVASGAPSNMKRVLRHPQLLSVVIWSACHLLANGETRSIVLFGGLGLWAIGMMPLLDRRDGEWVRPEPRPVAGDVATVAIAAVVFFGVRWAHPWVTGLPATY